MPTGGNGTDSSAASYEESIVPLMDVLSRFRDTIKDRAAEGAIVINQLCEDLAVQILAHSTNAKAEVLPLVEALQKFKDQINAKAAEGPKELFRLCDELRDDVLPHHGVRIEDRAKGQAAVWKYEDKEVLLKERNAKIQEKENKEEEKRRRKEEDNRKKSTSA